MSLVFDVVWLVSIALFATVSSVLSSLSSLVGFSSFLLSAVSIDAQHCLSAISSVLIGVPVVSGVDVAIVVDVAETESAVAAAAVSALSVFEFGLLSVSAVAASSDFTSSFTRSLVVDVSAIVLGVSGGGISVLSSPAFRDVFDRRFDPLPLGVNV